MLVSYGLVRHLLLGSWSITFLRLWLESLELAQYSDAFEANEIDVKLLPQVDDHALKDFLVFVLGHRLRLRAAIAALSVTRAEPPTPLPTGATPEATVPRQVTVMYCDGVDSPQRSERSDAEPRPANQLRPLVGCDDEIARLLRYWERANVGEGRVVLIAGEPGIGKSWMLHELRISLAADTFQPPHYQCSGLDSQSALHPFIEQSERAAGFAAADDPAQWLRKTQARLLQTLPGPEASAALPLFSAMRLVALPLRVWCAGPPCSDAYAKTYGPAT